MVVKYVNDCRDKSFTLNKEYLACVCGEFLEIIDDNSNRHWIASKNNELGRFEGDDFFRKRFKFVWIRS